MTATHTPTQTDRERMLDLQQEVARHKRSLETANSVIREQSDELRRVATGETAMRLKAALRIMIEATQQSIFKDGKKLGTTTWNANFEPSVQMARALLAELDKDGPGVPATAITYEEQS